MYCICCKEDKVDPYDFKYPDSKIGGKDSDKTEIEMLWEKTPSKTPSGDNYNRTINNAMVNDGIIQIIDAGYGSKQDGDKIIIAICDDCIKENLEDATLLYYGNYMFEGKHTDDEVEKSKKKYKRRKNLDKLV